MEKTNFVGVDCHKNTIACYVNGKFKEFKTDFNGFKKALEWAGQDCSWALEGAYSYGLTFSVFLLESSTGNGKLAALRQCRFCCCFINKNYDTTLIRGIIL